MITETSQNGRIRRTILPVTLSVAGAAAAPAIQLSVSSLAFSGAAGAANPAAQTIGVSNTGSGTLTWTANDNAAWLTLTPAGGTNAGTIAASVNMAGLAAGTYNTTISVAATGTATKSLPVTLTVTNSSPTSGITTAPFPIAFTGTVGPGPLTVPVTFTNTGATSVNFTWTDSISWIRAGYPAGTLSPGQSVTYSMTANISGMAQDPIMESQPSQPEGSPSKCPSPSHSRQLLPRRPSGSTPQVLALPERSEGRILLLKPSLFRMWAAALC